MHRHLEAAANKIVSSEQIAEHTWTKLTIGNIGYDKSIMWYAIVDTDNDVDYFQITNESIYKEVVDELTHMINKSKTNDTFEFTRREGDIVDSHYQGTATDSDILATEMCTLAMDILRQLECKNAAIRKYRSKWVVYIILPEEERYEEACISPILVKRISAAMTRCAEAHEHSKIMGVNISMTSAGTCNIALVMDDR